MVCIQVRADGSQYVSCNTMIPLALRDQAREKGISFSNVLKSALEETLKDE